MPGKAAAYTADRRASIGDHSRITTEPAERSSMQLGGRYRPPYGDSLELYMSPPTEGAPNGREEKRRRDASLIPALLIITGVFILVGLVIVLTVFLTLSLKDTSDPPGESGDSEIDGQTEVAMSLTILDNFTEVLRNRSSHEYAALERKVVASMNDVFLNSSLGKVYNRTDVTGFREGSVIADIAVHFTRVTLQDANSSSSSSVGVKSKTQSLSVFMDDIETLVKQYINHCCSLVAIVDAQIATSTTDWGTSGTSTATSQPLASSRTGRSKTENLTGASLSGHPTKNATDAIPSFALRTTGVPSSTTPPTAMGTTSDHVTGMSTEDLTSQSDMLNAGSCGMQQESGLVPAASAASRVVGGSEASIARWPWMASLRDPHADHRCGAALIADRWLVTAAHCVGYFSYAVLGSADLHGSGSGRQTRAIARTVPHPLYDPLNLDNDIALVELTSAVRLGAAVGPLCLDDGQSTASALRTCYVTGWGHTSTGGALSDRLQEARLQLVTNDVCQQMYQSIDAHLISSNQICAGEDEGGIDTCQGDSGGPLACLGPDSRWRLVGVTSSGNAECGAPESPGVYTRVSRYIDFLRHTLASDS